MERRTQKITPNLWFDRQAEEAAVFYTSLFRNSRITNVSRYSEAGREQHGMKPGSAMVVEYELDGFRFSALNGGPYFTLNPSISFIVNCANAAEVDELWNALSEGGNPLMPLDRYDFSERYGWIEDRFGVSWQLIFSDTVPEQRIIPSMLFVGEVCGKAEEAIAFYTSIFPGSAEEAVYRYGADQAPDTAGSVMFADFRLQGELFAAADSAHEHAFGFGEAISFVVDCSDQAEVDYYWERLSAVPEAERCAWLKDKFGVSWQIVPSVLPQLLSGPDPAGSKRAMEAMLEMKKIDIAALRRAYEGG